jgi:hypothetical protein
VVDWERQGKARRQAGAGTQINRDTPADLERVRAATDAPVLCRINGAGPTTREEVERAVALGADEILLPMVRRPVEVEETLAMVDGRCGLGILVETQDAVDAVDDVAVPGLSRVYVGLNDLRIDRGSSALFTPLVDGTVEHVRERVAARCGARFGVAGLTLPERGHPVPSLLLAGELARLRADFTFLRRSFHTDTSGRDLRDDVPRIRASVTTPRTAEQVTADRDALVVAVTGCAVGVVAPQPA